MINSKSDIKLTIDTASETAGLGLVRDGEVIAESTWQCGQSHTIQLLPHLTNLLEENRLALQSIDGIIVARGPGSYNGLRVGISTAKGLALVLGVPVVGVSSLEVVAYPHAESGLPVCPIFNASREEIAAAIFQMTTDGWQRLVDEHITTVDALCSQIDTRTIFCGEFVAAVKAQIRERLGQKAEIASLPTGQWRTGVLARIGIDQIEAGSYENPANLQPLYLRRPSITQAKHR